MTGQISGTVTDAAGAVLGGATVRLTNDLTQPVRGRDWLGIIQTLPGVVDLNNHGSPRWNSGTPTINGGQGGQLAISLDGVLSQDSGSPGANGWLAPSPDAIGEVKVLISNFAADICSPDEWLSG